MLAFLSSFLTRKSNSETHSMATTPTPPTNTKPGISKSRFLPTEYLGDWWLAKADDETQGTILAVSGQTLAGKQPMRFCSSLPILKRHDVFTLETTDGKTVILKGFLNKERSLNNGFPSDVCNHFMFGFPDYWKQFTQPFMVKEPSPDISTPKSGTAISDSRKKSNKINNLGDSPSKVKSGKGMTSSEDAAVHTKKKAWTRSVSKLGKVQTSSETEEISIHTTKKARTCSMSTFGSGVNSLEEISSDTKIKARTRSTSKCGKGLISSEQIPSDTKNEAAARSRSRLEIKQMNSQASVVLDSPLKDQLDRGLTSPKEISSEGQNKATTHSLSRSENEQKNSIASVVHSGGEKNRSVSLSLDFDKVELGHGESNREVNSGFHFEDNTQLYESNNDKTNSNELVDAYSVEQIAERSNLEDGLKRVHTRGLVKQMSENKVISSLIKPVSDNKSSPKKATAPCLSETSNQEKDTERVQTKGMVKQKSKSKEKPASSRKNSSKAKSAQASHLTETSNPGKYVGRVKKKGNNATTSHTKPISDEGSLSENAKAPSMKRKVAYETPKREKKRAPVDSPQLSKLKRSRSGRLLTPRLEFWRNQRKICDADGTVTGIKLDMEPEQPITGSETKARKKRRQL